MSLNITNTLTIMLNKKPSERIREIAETLFKQGDFLNMEFLMINAILLYLDECAEEGKERV